MDSTLRLSSPNVSKTAPLSCNRRMCVVIQTIPSTAFWDRQPPLIQMILPLFFLLASLLQHYGSEAESSHVSKFHPPGVKEQNGEFSLHFVTCRQVVERNTGITLSMFILTGLEAILWKCTSCFSLNGDEWAFHSAQTALSRIGSAKLPFTFKVYPCMFKGENPLKFQVPRETFSPWS